jgi:membrane protein YdbS with pleckstrin-like domain
MLTNAEKDFIRYWEENRLKKQKVTRMLYVGLPLAVVLVSSIFINSVSGWYVRADASLRTNSSEIIVLLVASLIIVAFVVIFSARHRWDMNEQKFRELKAREEKQ